jgi:hypothetical protein
MAAGNSPQSPLEQKYPQKLGTRDNTVITVGGVTKTGTLYKNTSPKENGQAGSMSVFAPAEDIVVPGDPSVPDEGTSQAAAIVVSANVLSIFCFVYFSYSQYEFKTSKPYTKWNQARHERRVATHVFKIVLWSVAFDRMLMTTHGANLLSLFKLLTLTIPETILHEITITVTLTML